ncbi:unnamed protein product [Bursaphelenchus okinawaensis]|uniref:Uncharacterized protein n=1 Tax=Bursaphelenchus okinawaensis TaxID=465554 RepID=A0A811LTK2_9BILA|nr:unnamed protein product [Bursaphelenchus okinawaensis]CAG9128678.1 unnamed protein product [Bursaphelenchus okinawaensis]
MAHAKTHNFRVDGVAICNGESLHGQWGVKVDLYDKWTILSDNLVASANLPPTGEFLFDSSTFLSPTLYLYISHRCNSNQECRYGWGYLAKSSNMDTCLKHHEACYSWGTFELNKLKDDGASEECPPFKYKPKDDGKQQDPQH